MSGFWFLEVLLAPVAGLVWVFEKLDPGFSGSIRIGYGPGRDQIHWGFLGAVYFTAAGLLWGIRAGWRRLRKRKPRAPRTSERLLFVTKIAALVSIMAFVALRFRVRGDATGGEAFMAGLLFAVLVFTGLWAVVVEKVGDRVVARLSGQRGGEVKELPASGGVA